MNNWSSRISEENLERKLVWSKIFQFDSLNFTTTKNNQNHSCFPSFSIVTIVFISRKSEHMRPKISSNKNRSRYTSAQLHNVVFFCTQQQRGEKIIHFGRFNVNAERLGIAVHAMTPTQWEVENLFN